MKTALGNYLNAIRANYTTRNGAVGDNSEIRQRMAQEFSDANCTRDGAKYIKVITGPQISVHSFIVKEDMTVRGKVFKRGDILKAASWSAPALNFARGNVFALNADTVRWTGA